MAHQITAVDNKAKDWKVVSILNAAGDIVENVSINRTNKKGDIFPNFDGIAVGQKIEGQLWQSPAGKMYLFAPKDSPKTPSTPETNDFTVSNAEIKNILMLRVIPMLDAIHQETKQGKTIKHVPMPDFGEKGNLEENPF